MGATLEQLTNESFVSLTEATKCLPNRPSVRTIWRWYKHGIRARTGERIYLETWKLGGLTFTTREALARFVEAIG